MVRSTFTGFNMALLGLNASQKALDVTGQNITNMNTEGYTRQRLDLSSITPSGPSAYMGVFSTKVGQGVEMTGVSQLRDPYLDIQYRRQLTKTGTYDAKDQVLGQIGNIFDKVDVSTTQNALDGVVQQLQKLTTSVGGDGTDGMVRSSFDVLINQLHENATSLEEVKTNLIGNMEDTMIPKINDILEKIGDLNKSIKNANILGDPALELQDRRNQALDELSTYLPIDVKTRKTDMGAGVVVEELDVQIKGSSNYLVHGDNIGEVGFETTGNDIPVKLKITQYSVDNTTDPPTVTKEAAEDFTNKLADGVLKGNLDMLNCRGSIDGTQTKGIAYYQALLDSFASTLATKMNELNTDADGVNHPLFTTSDGTDVFTASNLQISEDWIKGNVSIVNSIVKGPDGKISSTAADNILRMKNLLSTDTLSFKGKDKDGKEIELFSGTMPGSYANIQNTQGLEKSSNEDILDNHLAVLQDSSDNRDSVSGVLLDEEVMNLMKYAQTYSAAAKLMTVMDEAISALINMVR